MNLGYFAIVIFSPLMIILVSELFVHQMKNLNYCLQLKTSTFV